MTTRPVRRLIGERGPEAVLPLHRQREFMGGGGGGPSFGVTIQSTSDVDRMSPAERSRYYAQMFTRSLEDDPTFQRWVASRLRGTF